MFKEMTSNTDPKLERLFFFGRPLSPLYSFMMAKRSSLYQKGTLKQNRLEVPVISVGNLVLGGTGKTPLVHYIANYLRLQGRKPAILSRGYKGSGSTGIQVVSNNEELLLDAVTAGDEPRLLAEKLPGTPVITGKERFATGHFAIDSFGSDILILDDGFQHMALARDVNLVLFSAGKLLGNGRVLPGGELREPISALQRADAFIISGLVGSPDRYVKDFIDSLNGSYPDKPLFTGGYKPEKLLPGILDNNTNDILLEKAARMKVFGFCGIARPDSFKETLLQHNFDLTGFQPFEDHQAYSQGMLEMLIRAARDKGAEALITTEKDLVKVRSIFPKGFFLLALPVNLHMDADFDRFLSDRLASLRLSKN